jgi:hypothetical protein
MAVWQIRVDPGQSCLHGLAAKALAVKIHGDAPADFGRLPAVIIHDVVGVVKTRNPDEAIAGFFNHRPGTDIHQRPLTGIELKIDPALLLIIDRSKLRHARIGPHRRIGRKIRQLRRAQSQAHGFQFRHTHSPSSENRPA